MASTVLPAPMAGTRTQTTPMAQSATQWGAHSLDIVRNTSRSQAGPMAVRTAGGSSTRTW
ncbi:MAG: hypothetical protein IPF99_33030 [Deltaproteobacteria bacterium]|nr:hypothetical protein [Deltaproteobacteria bacterium]